MDRSETETTEVCNFDLARLDTRIIDSGMAAVEEMAKMSDEFDASYYANDAIALFREQKYGDAIPLLKKAVMLREKPVKKNDQVLLTFIMYLTDTYMKVKRFSEALELMEDARSKFTGKKEQKILVEKTALIWKKKGFQANLEGDYVSALERYEKGWTIDPENVDLVELVAGLLLRFEQYGKAVDIISQTRQMERYRSENILDQFGQQVIEYLLHVGTIQEKKRLCHNALPIYKLALTLSREFGTKHEVDSLSGVASCYVSMNRYTDGKAKYEQAIKSSWKLYGNNNNFAIRGMTDLASLYSLMKRYDDSLSMYRNVLKLKEQKYGAHSKELIVILEKISRLDTLMNNPTAARKTIYRIASIREKNLKPELIIQTGHSKGILASAFSPDRKYVLSGGYNNLLKLWELATGREIRTFKGHLGEINSVAFSGDGRFGLSGSIDKTVRLWNIRTGEEVRTFIGHLEGINSVNFSPDGKYAISAGGCTSGHIMTYCADTTIKLWDIESGQEIRSFTGHSGTINSVTFSPDGQYILSGSSDRTIKLWEISSGLEVSTFSGHSKAVTSVVFSQNGMYALSGSGDKTVKLWDISFGELIQTFEGRSDDVVSVAFLTDRFILSADYWGNILARGIESGEVVGAITPAGHKGRPISVTFSPDGFLALSGGSSVDRTVKLWDILKGKQISEFSGSLEPVYSVIYSPDGNTVFSGSLDGMLSHWDLNSGKMIRSFYGHGDTGKVKSSFSPDSRYVVFWNDKSMNYREVISGKEINTITEESVRRVAISAGGRYSFSKGWAGTPMKYWDLASGREISSLPGQSRWGDGLAISPNGLLALSGSRSDNSLKLWNLKTGDKILTLSGHSGSVETMVFSPDARFALSGSTDKSAILWDLSSGLQIQSFIGHKDFIETVAFSPDGKNILTGGRDKTIKLWDIATGKEIRTFTGHGSIVKSVVFSPDGRFALSGSDDRTMMIWEVSTGSWLARLISFPDGTWVVVDPEGHFDTNAIEGINGLHWLLPDDPMTPLPFKSFMKEHYEPRLLLHVLDRPE